MVINAQPATPPTPVISANILVLQSSAASGNQWYNQSGPISGATSQNYTVTANGSYYVIVTVNGCPSDTSNIIQITNVGIELNQNAKEIKIYPNPVTNELTIEIVGNKAPTAFEIHNAIGQLILKDNILNKKVISTINFPLGVYIVKLENGKTFEFKKVVKE